MSKAFQALMDWLKINNEPMTLLVALAAPGIATISLLITIPTWLATRRQAILARQTFEAGNSPYVSIRIEEPGEPSKQGELAVKVVFENQGSVLAHLIKREMVGTLVDLNVHISLPPGLTVCIGPSYSTLVPGHQRVVESIFCDERLPDTIPFFEFQAMMVYKGSGPSIYLHNGLRGYTYESGVDQSKM